MNIQKFKFGNVEIEFDLCKNENMMVNATEMAKVYGKEVSGFLKTETTKNFVEAYCRAEDLPSEKEFTPAGMVIKVIASGRNNGTWMNEIAAIKFAAWLNPDFEVWVYKTIKEILFGDTRKRDLSFKRTLEVKKRIKELKEKVVRTGEDFTEYLQLDAELKLEQNSRSRFTVERINEIQVLIFTENEMKGEN